MEFIPAFALYRGLYELSQSAFIGNYQGTQGTMTWSNLASTGCATAMVILAVEWLIFLLLALYLDQVVSSGSGVRKSPFFFLQGLFPNSKNKKRGAKGPATHAPDTPKNEASVEVERQRPDVEHEVSPKPTTQSQGLAQWSRAWHTEPGSAQRFRGHHNAYKGAT